MWYLFCRLEGFACWFCGFVIVYEWVLGVVGLFLGLWFEIGFGYDSFLLWGWMFGCGFGFVLMWVVNCSFGLCFELYLFTVSLFGLV